MAPPVYKVVAGGREWYTMYEWWEIVVYYESSIQELISESITTDLHKSCDWFGGQLEHYRYVNWRIQAHVGS